MPNLDLYEGQMIAWQEAATRDNHPYKVCVCGRKARKTTFMINELAFWAMTDREKGLTYPYFAPFRKQAKQIVWDDHIARILRLCNTFGIKYRINQSDLTIRFDGAGKLQIDGMDNAEAHRGKSDWGGVAVDEAASTRLKYIWEEIIRPNLQVHHAFCLFGGTPKGFDYFYELAKLGDHDQIIDEKTGLKDRNFISFHASSYDNPYNDPEWLEDTRATTDVDEFRREYLAEFVRYSGLVYPEFDYATHVGDFSHEYNAHGDYYFGFDFATRGYQACLVGFVKTDGHVYILDEYKEKGETASTHGEKIKELLEKYADLTKYAGYADPAGWAKNQQNKDLMWSLADEYIEQGFPLVQGNNEVVAGINFIRQLLLAKKLHIHFRCEKLIAEFYQYQWKEQSQSQVSQLDEPEKVRKINDHLLDALRYMVYSKPSAPDEIQEERKTLFPGQLIEMPLKLDEEDPSADKYTEIKIASFLD